ncbi:MAG: DUF4166 domain-containing protein, partial [Hyphomicrobiales bacterium]
MTPLYRRALGPRFDDLSPVVRDLHDLKSVAIWKGEADVERGTNILSRIAGWITSLPPAGSAVPLEVTFEPAGEAEIWTRRFGQAVFQTRQSHGTDGLCETAGPATFTFAIDIADGAMMLRLVGMRVFGIPVPAPLRPVIATREEQDAAG